MKKFIQTITGFFANPMFVAVKNEPHKCNMKYKYSVMPMKYSDGYDMYECKCGNTEKKNKTSTLHAMFD